MTSLKWSHAFLALLPFVLMPASAGADPLGTADRNDPAQVLAYQGDAVLTQQAIDAAFSRIPEEHRLMFIRDGEKVDQLVRSLLHAKRVAEDARAAGFAEDPQVQERLAQAIEKELAEAWVQELAHRAPEADFDARAYENYLASPESYSTGVELDVSHILVGTQDRTAAEARSLAMELRSRLEEQPERFGELVREYSDDPAKLTNGGKYKRMGKGQMVKSFEQAAYALTTPGQISDPVETEYGYHLIRLDARHEAEVPQYDEIRDEAVWRVKRKHVEGFRTRYLQKLMLDPVVFPKGSVEVMARRHFGDNLEKAPIFTEDLGD